MTAIATFDAGKAMVKVATVEKLVNNLLNVRSPETEFCRESIIVDADKLFEIVFDAAIPNGGFRTTRMVDCGSIVHCLNNIGEQKANDKRK